MFLKQGNMQNRIICWWSGGVTSAVACKLALDLYRDSCEFIMIDTGNEDPDTYRFKKDCERWYNAEIKTIGRVGAGKSTLTSKLFGKGSLP